MTSNNRIPLFATRTMSEKVNAAIDFLRENWRVGLRFSIYLLLPLALLQSVQFYDMVQAARDEYTPGITLNSQLWTLAVMLIAGCTIYTVVLTLMQYYQDRRFGNLSSLTFAQARGTLWRNFRRVLVAMIPIAATTFLLMLLAFALLLTPVSIFGVLAMMAMTFVMLMIPILYVLEDITLGQAVSRTFAHAKQSWAKLFGLMLAMMLIVLMLQSVTAAPLGVFAFVTSELDINFEANTTAEVIGNILLFLFFIFESFFTYMALALVITTMVFHYGSDAKSHDDIGLADDIMNFENL